MKKKLCALLAFSMLLVGCKSNGRQIDASYDVDVYKDYMTMDNRVDSLNYLVTVYISSLFLSLAISIGLLVLEIHTYRMEYAISKALLFKEIENA